MTKRIFALALVLVLALALVACGGDTSSTPASTGGAASTGGDATSTPAATGGTVKIGLSTTMTLRGAFIGEAAKAAIDDYIVDLNARGGLLGSPVELVVYDYAVDPATEAVTTCNRMIEQDKVLAILGPTSSQAALPMADMVDAAKVPMITSGTNTKVTVADDGTVHPYVFRVCYIDPYLGEVTAKYAWEKMGLKDIAVLSTIGDAYSEGLAQNFVDSYTALGGNVVAVLGHQQNDVEFRAQITDAQSKGAEAIFMPQSTYAVPVLFANQAADLGAEFQYILGDAVYDEHLLTEAGANMEGAVCAMGVYDNSPEFDTYKEEFVANHPGNSANMYALYAVDFITYLEWAVNDCGSLDREAIRDSLENAKNIELFTDKDFTMDPATHNPLNKTVNVVKIEDSQYVFLESFKPE